MSINNKLIVNIICITVVLFNYKYTLGSKSFFALLKISVFFESKGQISRQETKRSCQMMFNRSTVIEQVNWSKITALLGKLLQKQISETIWHNYALNWTPKVLSQSILCVPPFSINYSLNTSGQWSNVPVALSDKESK